MSLLELFFATRKPGWMTRERGRQFVELLALGYDALIEGFLQARMGAMGIDPDPSHLPYQARDTGVINGITESPSSYALRRARWRWSWRASGLAGVANVHFNAVDWMNAGGTPPTDISGTPTEAGNWIAIDSGGTIGIAGILYSVSIDGGLSYITSGQPLGTSDTFVAGDVQVKFRPGQVIPNGTMYLPHGGRGLLLNDLGAPNRTTAAASPAGDEGLIYEIARLVGPCRVQLIDASGTWWTRKPDGYTWRLTGGPWAWDPVEDADPSYWSRGLVVITNPPGIDPWELLSLSTHYLGEPLATYGTTAPIEWWNRLYVTILNRKPANMRVNVILNFDDTKFDPSDATTCPQDTWSIPVTYDMGGNAVPSRPIDYAWFSGSF